MPQVPVILPLGDRALLVRFDDGLSEAANIAAVAFAARAEAAALPGVIEVAPNLVSVMLRYETARIAFEMLAGEVRLLLSAEGGPVVGKRHVIEVRFDGEDLTEVAAATGMTVTEFIAAHDARPLRALATGFAPGFLYLGFHAPQLIVPRRTEVRALVPAGTVLFAARQTAIAATPIRTGWHVIGHTEFRNFDPAIDPPTRIAAGDEVSFEAAA